MRIELSHKDSEGEVEEEQIQDAMELVECLNEEIKPKGRKNETRDGELIFSISNALTSITRTG